MTRLVIKKHPGRHLRLIQAAVALALLLVGWGLFEYGRYRAGYDTLAMTTERIEHAGRVAELERAVAELREQKAILEQASQIDRQAYGQLEGELGGLREEIIELNREVTFYRGIVTPQGGSGVLRLQRFEVTPSGIERGFRYQLVLTQAFTNSAVTSGVVTLNVEGVAGQVTKTFTLAELTDNKVKELSFRFKYFQEIAGELVLPAGFIPRRAVVTIEPRGGEKLQKSYDWPA
ncbi:MAG TPA: DUF6776 family protein [Gammaproteobacteria bacterium]